MPVTKMKACSISTMTSFTRAAAEASRGAVGQADEPRRHRREAIGGRAVESRDIAIGNPSDETTTASSTPGTRSTKLEISQETLVAAGDQLGHFHPPASGSGSESVVLAAAQA